MDKPTIPKGTRDFGPAQMARRQYIFDRIKKVFQKYGFLPLETPTMENLSTLTGKYGEEGDQLLFKVLNSGDFLKEIDATQLEARNLKVIAAGLAEKGLRYDLTVPFARYVVMNRHEITFPFRRYQMQPVWRADRPQKGRYREFYQCDADVIGTNSLICETEIILMIHEVFAALNITGYSVRINHRAILSGLARLTGAMDETALLVAIDKLEKIGEEKVKEELRTKGFTESNLTLLFEILNFNGNPAEKIKSLTTKFQNLPEAQKGIVDLTTILNLLQGIDSVAQPVEFDISLARGLSYYTGCIFEVVIHQAEVGSVCGGGRYDNLTGVFGMPGVSGVGISFGVDRIYDAMEALQLFPKDTQSSTKVLVACMDEASQQYGWTAVHTLRKSGIAAEIYPDLTKLAKQLDYANKKLIPFVIVIGSEEVASGLLTFKNMEKGVQEKLTLNQILEYDF